MKTKSHEILVVTTVHAREDTRIAVKEVASLRESLDAQVILYVQDGLGDVTDDAGNLVIVDIGPRPKKRLERMFFGSWRMLRAIQHSNATIVHFHDPELIPICFILKLSGIRIIYDAHENLPKQIQNKTYIPRILRWVIGRIVSVLEWIAVYIFDGVAVASTSIADRFPTHKTILLRNYPLPDEIVQYDAPKYSDRPNYFTYVGGLTDIRGTIEMIEAIGLVEISTARLQLAGDFKDKSLHDEAQAISSWDRVDFHGYVDREEVSQIDHEDQDQ